MHASPDCSHSSSERSTSSPDSEVAEGTTILTVYQAAAASTDQAIPAVVGEYQDRFVRTAGSWRFVSRRSALTFTR